jgi:hypothetical protein
MFDKKVQAKALILADEGSGNVVDTDIHGVDWNHHKFILEVRPGGEDSFRVETKAKVPIFSHPHPGDLVRVTYDPKNHKTEIQIEGDLRYDPKLIRANEKQQRATTKEALLSGAPLPSAPAIADDPYENPRWQVPATCPECGARVDQSTESMADHPTCLYCAKPLPCDAGIGP